MRIKRSVALSFWVLVFPSAAIALVAYFGAHAVWGDRGLVVLEDMRADLGMERHALAVLEDRSGRLRHRIALLDGPRADPDLVEELARTRLMDGAPGQVAIPRAPQGVR